MTLTVLGSVVALSLLIVILAALQRRFFWVRQLAFPLYVAAGVATLEMVTLLQPGYQAAAVAHALDWAWLFLGLITILRLLGLYLFDVHLTAKRGMRLPPLLPAVTMTVVYLVTAFVTLRMSFPKLDVTALVATSAVTSLVLGLALQPILGNFFAGLVISVEKPFRINDWIKVGEQEGRVTAITWRTTHLRTRDNDNLVIPNAKLADERVLNYYYPHPVHREKVRVGVHYDEPPYRVRRVLLECAAGVPGVLDKPAPDVTAARLRAERDPLRAAGLDRRRGRRRPRIAQRPAGPHLGGVPQGGDRHPLPDPDGGDRPPASAAGARRRRDGGGGWPAAGAAVRGRGAGARPVARARRRRAGHGRAAPAPARCR